MGGLTPPPPPSTPLHPCVRAAIFHLAAAPLMLSSALKPSTSAAAPWDSAQATVLQRRTAAGRLGGQSRGSTGAGPQRAHRPVTAEREALHSESRKNKHHVSRLNQNLVCRHIYRDLFCQQLLSDPAKKPVDQIHKLWLIPVNMLTTETFHSSLTQTH